MTMNFAFATELLVFWFGYLFPVGLASSAINITAVKPFRVGDTITISCQVPYKITKCSWDVTGGQQKPLLIIDTIRGTTSSEGFSGCVAKVEQAIEDFDGSVWMCTVVAESGIVKQAQTTITIISVPNVSLLRPRTPRMTFTAGEENEIGCVVNNARPVPKLVWKLGDNEVDSNFSTVLIQMGQNTKATIYGGLKMPFQPKDNNKILRCIAEADWLRTEDKTTDQTTLDIQFPPVPQNAITLYGFEENKSGEVQVTVHANPRPHRAFWNLPTPSNDTLEVEGNSVVDDSAASNYVGLRGEDNGNDTFTYRLHIRSVQQRDANPGIKFRVLNMVGTRETAEQYSIRVDTHQRPEPVPGRHMASSGSTACCVVTKHWQMFFPLFVLAVAIF